MNCLMIYQQRIELLTEKFVKIYKRLIRKKSITLICEKFLYPNLPKYIFDLFKRHTCYRTIVERQVNMLVNYNLKQLDIC